MSEKTALLTGNALAPDGEPEGGTEAAAPSGLETPELLAGYLAKIGKGSLLTHRLRITRSRPGLQMEKLGNKRG